VRKLYESVMSYACHGLFFREGMVLAEEVTKTLPLGEDPLDAGTKLILERGWAEEVSFTDSGARVRGSIEAMPGADMETCHRLKWSVSAPAAASASSSGRRRRDRPPGHGSGPP